MILVSMRRAAMCEHVTSAGPIWPRDYRQKWIHRHGDVVI